MVILQNDRINDNNLRCLLMDLWRRDGGDSLWWRATKEVRPPSSRHCSIVKSVVKEANGVPAAYKKYCVVVAAVTYVYTHNTVCVSWKRDDFPLKLRFINTSDYHCDTPCRIYCKRENTSS